MIIICPRKNPSSASLHNSSENPLLAPTSQSSFQQISSLIQPPFSSTVLTVSCRRGDENEPVGWTELGALIPLHIMVDLCQRKNKQNMQITHSFQWPTCSFVMALWPISVSQQMKHMVKIQGKAARIYRLCDIKPGFRNSTYAKSTNHLNGT